MSKHWSQTLPIVQSRAASMTVEESDLPAGIVGRVTGIAVRYDVVDSYGTLFKRGCLDKTKAKVRAGKVKLFVNHGARDFYGPDTHIGVVRSLTPAGDGEIMVADIFDTEAGRRQKEYLTAVMASGGETGLSIGFFEREGSWEMVNGAQVYSFQEIELDEISLAPRNAVPGADVMGVRSESVSRETRHRMAQQLAQGMTRAQWIEFALSIVATNDDESSSEGMEPEETSMVEDDSPEMAAIAERLLAARRTYTL